MVIIKRGPKLLIKRMPHGPPPYSSHVSGRRSEGVVNFWRTRNTELAEAVDLRMHRPVGSGVNFAARARAQTHTIVATRALAWS